MGMRAVDAEALGHSGIGSALPAARRTRGKRRPFFNSPRCGERSPGAAKSGG
jgi:hypothetical protein